ncbi:MAG TPA: type II toxin-antitoxin system VapC family toxin [Kofleriaceae bacterium]|nr:type II toxin-antitoxin system VapC family toxin [Kofleriaceae bacterium]
MILLDTHALLWWALDPSRLSTVAQDRITAMEQQGGLASSISIWELGIKVRRGKLELGMDIEEFTRRVERSAVIELVPVGTAIWLRSLQLAWEHRDPADRVIVATALDRGVPILTKDEVLHRFGGVDCVW